MDDDSLFGKAMQIEDTTARAAWLAEACGGDIERRQHIEGLLKAIGSAGGFLQEPMVEGCKNALDQLAEIAVRAEDVSGTVIGSYKLIEQIGEGGMGTVWLAEQIHPVRRQVALKVIKPGMDSRRVIARFEAERQALSLMDHPNIARVLDAGTSADQRPFFVMELVQGRPITQYCDENQLTVRNRLMLCLSVCNAIQHAHQKGIIHRDIKPSNVLIAEYDNRPVAKVIDFGVAKALSQPLAEATLMTGLGQIVGTVEYMSPEQARVNQVDIDTRSDIYSLGVLLYELLTGSTPFDRERVRSTAFDEMLRVIREEEPPRPSRKLSSNEMLAQVAAFRTTEPSKLTTLVQGELDWIVMKALEKDRNRRYETANGLAMDIQRYLDGEIIQACPPSTGYRVKKLLQRNRTAAIAGLLVLLSLVGGITAATIGMVKAQQSEKAERLAREAERLARENEALQRGFAEAITEFVQKDLLALTSVEGQLRFDETGLTPLSKDTTLKELLDRAAAKLDTRTDLAPQAEARLRWMIGVNYRGMGEYERSIPHLERSVTLSTENYGDGHEVTLDAMSSLAVAYNMAGHVDKCVPLYETILERSLESLGPDHPETLASMNNLAVGYRVAGKLDKVLPLLEQTLQRSIEVLGPDHPDTLATMANLAGYYHVVADLDKALPLMKQTLELRKAKLGLDHPETIDSMCTLAAGYFAQGHLDKALPLIERTRELAVRTLGSDHPLTLVCMSNLANARLSAGDVDEAISLFEEVLRLQEAKLGRSHPFTLSTIASLGIGYEKVGRLDEGILLLEEVTAVNPTNPELQGIRESLRTFYLRAGRTNELDD